MTDLLSNEDDGVTERAKLLGMEGTSGALALKEFRADEGTCFTEAESPEGAGRGPGVEMVDFRVVGGPRDWRARIGARGVDIAEVVPEVVDSSFSGEGARPSRFVGEAVGGGSIDDWRFILVEEARVGFVVRGCVGGWRAGKGIGARLGLGAILERGRKRPQAGGQAKYCVLRRIRISSRCVCPRKERP